ncbi:replication protein RepA [Xanthomonas albilineans]|uniref:replication protein RepA n=1 Tax=Xanthomonas albilineans TaxID=29447 RepID=UPI0005F30850|nr:replication protein RepA [Xanthomonas albilineans]
MDTLLKKKDAKLVEASAAIMGSPPEGDDIAFLHSTFCQVGLPRSKPKGDTFERKSGNAAVRLEAGTLWDGADYIKQPLPYGTKPRLLLLHLIRSYLRTGNRTIDLGESVRDFLQNTLNIDASGGAKGGMTGFREQIKAFAACRMVIGYNMPTGAVRTRPAERLVEEFEAWPETNNRNGQRILWPSSITISADFAASIEKASVPLDARAIQAIQDSALAIDLYSWLAHRLHRLDRPAILHWASLRGQFGQEIADPRNFKRNFVKAMRDVLVIYPQAKVEDVFGGIRINPSQPPVTKTLVVACK